MALRRQCRAPKPLFLLPDPLTRLARSVRMRHAGAMSEALRELIDIAGRHADGRRVRTAIPHVSIGRSEATTAPVAGVWGSGILFVLQGAKTVLIGDRALRYDPASYFIYTVETPTISRLMVGVSTV